MTTPKPPVSTPKALFTVPIPTCESHPGGSVTVTEPAPQVYLLSILSPPDNRQTTALCQAVLRALDLVEFGGLPTGVVVTTSALPKFYSNGLDLEHAIKIGDGFWIESLWKLYRRFLTFPMPTVAYVFPSLPLEYVAIVKCNVVLYGIFEVDQSHVTTFYYSYLPNT